MKKQILLGVLAILITTPVMALPGAGNYGGALVSARNRGRQQDSAANLKQIGLAIMLYGVDKDDKFPDSFTDCVSYLSGNTSVFVAAGDRVSKAAASGAPIKKNNTSFAYIGKGLTLRSVGDASEAPIAFEKPQLFSKNQPLCVLYADGHVERVTVPVSARKNSAATAAYLAKRMSKDIQKIMKKNAAAED